MAVKDEVLITLEELNEYSLGMCEAYRRVLEFLVIEEEIFEQKLAEVLGVTVNTAKAVKADWIRTNQEKE